MSDEPFGRQLQPVRVIIEGREKIDREHWAWRLRGWLDHATACATNHLPLGPDREAFTIYPDANND